MGFDAVSLRRSIGSANDFAFAIVGDRTGGAQPHVYERIWREIDLRRPNFVLTVGDTIEGGNDATACEPKALQHACIPPPQAAATLRSSHRFKRRPPGVCSNRKVELHNESRNV